MLMLTVFLALQGDVATCWICADAAAGASSRAMTAVNTRRFRIEATSTRTAAGPAGASAKSGANALSAGGGACWVPASGVAATGQIPAHARRTVLRTGQPAVLLRLRMMSTIASWMRPFEATTSPLRESKG